MIHPTLHEEEKWHVLQVRPRSEKKVGQHLKEFGFKTFVPTQIQYRTWSDRRKKIETVLFNNYVFVATPPSRRNDVFMVSNVFKYLSFGGRIAVLSEKEIAMIQGFEQHSSVIRISYESFQIGDDVEILGGSLTGLRGNIIAKCGTTRLQLSLPSLQCFAQVEIQTEEIQLIPKNQFSLTQ